MWRWCSSPRAWSSIPRRATESGTLVNALLARLDNLSGVGGEIRPGIVHRIDKDTSGLLLVAKNDRAHVSPVRADQGPLGAPRLSWPSSSAISARTRASWTRPSAAIPPTASAWPSVPGGREAAHQLARAASGCAARRYIEARLTTGRTHQIRVHMASIGHPVLGDPVYGPKKSPYPVAGGQLLHAYRIGFVHPATGEEMLFEAPPEERFQKWLEKLRLPQ